MRRSAVVLLLLLLCAGGCAKGMAPRDAAAPEAASAPGGDLGIEDGYAGATQEGGRPYAGQEPSFDELQARFEQLDADLAAQGISGSSEAKMGTGAESAAKQTLTKEDLASRCERICSLEEAICDVSERICGLAETHEGETKYADACTRSESRCEQATTACSTCAG